MIKYYVHPGYVKSPNNGGEKHFINFFQLCRLHKVNPGESINGDSPHQVAGWSEEELKKLVHLYPHADGDYSRKEEAKDG